MNKIYKHQNFMSKAISKVSTKPARLITLSFFFTILAGSLLLTLPFAVQSGESIGFLKALFTATSATCVTGLVVVDTATTWSLFGQIVIIALIQIGGLGSSPSPPSFLLY
jgi:trk system potassium uptake protein TrkH